MALQLEIFSPSSDGFVKEIAWNHQQIKDEVKKMVENYTGLQYTEDQVTEAKADRAKLNNFIKAMDTERKRIKKQCMAPYEQFEAKVKEITNIVAEPIAMIDKQLADYEDKRKADKTAEIMKLIRDLLPDWVKPRVIWNDRWLNKTAKMSAIESELAELANKLENDISSLERLPECSFEAIDFYKSTLDLAGAISEANRIADMNRRKAEEEQRRAEAEMAKSINSPVTEDITFPEKQEKEPEPVTEDRQWVAFAAYVSMQESKDIAWFFKTKGIKYKPVRYN